MPGAPALPGLVGQAQGIADIDKVAIEGGDALLLQRGDFNAGGKEAADRHGDGSDWIANDRFDIVARLDGDPPPVLPGSGDSDVLRLAMQSLISEEHTSALQSLLRI